MICQRVILGFVQIDVVFSDLYSDKSNYFVPEVNALWWADLDVLGSALGGFVGVGSGFGPSRAEIGWKRDLVRSLSIVLVMSFLLFI